MSLTVTSLIAGCMALIVIPLSLQVSIRRAATNTTFGDGNDSTLRRRIRAHGNFSEYVALALVVLGLVEWNGAPTSVVWSLGIALLVSRVLHLVGMLYVEGPALRAPGMILQHLAFGVSGVWLIMHFLER
jgi:uncharacterized protein